MLKFREKWFWALGLAILVHVAVFSIFYLNTATQSPPASGSSVATTEPVALEPINVLPNDKRSTTTVIRTKTSASVDDSLEKDRLDTVNEHSTKTELASDDEQLSGSENTIPSTPHATDKINASVKKSTTDTRALPTQTVDQGLKAPPQENNSLKNQSLKDQALRDQALRDQAQQRVLSERINPDINIENLKNDAGLLDIDVPAQKSTVQIDKDYLSAKSEAEDINDQLSRAINEVKNRNQQKIDERQRLRNDALTKNPQDTNEILK